MSQNQEHCIENGKKCYNYVWIIEIWKSEIGIFMNFIQEHYYKSSLNWFQVDRIMEK